MAKRQTAGERMVRRWIDKESGGMAMWVESTCRPLTGSINRAIRKAKKDGYDKGAADAVFVLKGMGLASVAAGVLYQLKSK